MYDPNINPDGTRGVSGAPIQVRGSFTRVPQLGKDGLTLDSEMPVGDLYLNALREWCLFYAYRIDGEETPNTARSNRHLTYFYQLLGKEPAKDGQVEVARGQDDA